MYNELKSMAGSKFSLSAFNKKRIEIISKEIGVAFAPKNTKCTNCYHDQIIILMAKLSKSKCKYKTANATGYRFGGVLVNNDTLTNKLALWFLKQSPAHTNLLIKVEDDIKE